MPRAEPAARYRLVGYVTERADLSTVNLDFPTHLNCACARVSPTGEVVPSSPRAEAHLGQLRAMKARVPQRKVILSIGGWGADHFSDAAATERSRDTFAVSAVALVTKFSLDGIDIDWEYPGQPGPGIKYRAEDKQNFTSLLAVLRHRLDALAGNAEGARDRYALTVASSSGEYFAHTEMDRLHVYVDWFNVMAYDFYNAATPTTGHHAALYPSGRGLAERDAEGAIKQHLAAGIPSAKILLGVPLYGKSFVGVLGAGDGVGEPYAHYGEDYAYATLARDFIDKGGFRRRWDGQAQAPFLWNREERTFISYEDEESLRAKAAFVKRWRLGGMMYWEHGHDPDEVLVGVMASELAH